MCFLSRANSTARCRRWFVGEFFQVYIVFLVVAIFSNTECYSPSNLLVRFATYGHLCDVSIIELPKMITWHHSKHSMIILVTKPISITPVLSLARKASEKSSFSKRSLKAKANHSLKIFFRINHHTGAWVHWQCQSCLTRNTKKLANSAEVSTTLYTFSANRYLLKSPIFVLWEAYPQCITTGSSSPGCLRTLHPGCGLDNCSYIQSPISVLWEAGRQGWMTGGAQRVEVHGVELSAWVSIRRNSFLQGSYIHSRWLHVNYLWSHDSFPMSGFNKY